MKAKETFKLLEPIFNSIYNVVTLDSVTDNLNGTFTLFTCNTKWVTIGSTLTIGLNTYIVKDLVCNESILVSGVAMPLVFSFEIALPFVFRGTIIATSEELNNINLSWNKFPMIYVHDIIVEKYSFDATSIVERESELNLYFLVDSDNQNWLTKDHYNYAISPMRNLLFAFIDALDTSISVGLYSNGEVFNHAKFGVYFADKGHEKKIFNDDLSGTQLKITIPFLSTLYCNC